MAFRVEVHSTTPPSKQIVDHLLSLIAGGEIRVEERLPSIRSLAAEVLVNPNTVAKCYRELESRGICRAKNGSGVYVTDAGPRLARAAVIETCRREILASVARALQAGQTVDDILQIVRNALEPMETP